MSVHFSTKEEKEKSAENMQLWRSSLSFCYSVCQMNYATCRL